MRSGETAATNGLGDGADPIEQLAHTRDYTGLDGTQWAEYAAPGGDTIAVPRETMFPDIDQQLGKGFQVGE